MFPVRDPLIVNLASTGMIPTREKSAKASLQSNEIIADVFQTAEQGMTIAHLHARDTMGRLAYKKDVYARIISGIRQKRSGLVLCVACSGRVDGRIDRRAHLLELNGDLISNLLE